MKKVYLLFEDHGTSDERFHGVWDNPEVPTRLATVYSTMPGDFEVIEMPVNPDVPLFGARVWEAEVWGPSEDRPDLEVYWVRPCPAPPTPPALIPASYLAVPVLRMNIECYISMSEEEVKARALEVATEWFASNPVP
jgi:hypothetical protein